MNIIAGLALDTSSVIGGVTALRVAPSERPLPTPCSSAAGRPYRRLWGSDYLSATGRRVAPSNDTLTVSMP